MPVPKATVTFIRPAADALQIRCADRQRFIEKMGRVSPAILEEIAAAVAAVVEHQ